MEDIISRPVLDGPDLDAAIAHARAALTALLRVPAGGLGQAGRHDLLELELLDRTESLARAGSWSPAGLRPLRLTGSPT